jgi:hypothetical protein
MERLTRALFPISLIAALAVVGAGAATTAAGRAPGLDGQSCRPVMVSRDQLPATLGTYVLSNNRVVPAVSLPRDKLPASLSLEDCGDASFLGFTWSGRFYLVRKSDIANRLTCTCVTRGADPNAGVAGMGHLARCPNCP